MPRTEIPLFPLGTVLYPGLMLPLHIFEERYRLLVRSLLALPVEHRSFGVIAIRKGWEVGPDAVRALHEVGCAAELRAVEPYDDGRFDLVTTGTRRFRLLSVDGDSSPYLRGEIEWIDESPGEGADVLAAAVARQFLAYRLVLTGDADGAALPADPHLLSYLVAAAVILDLGDKQSLLEAADDAGRLREELWLLRREAAVLKRLPSLPAVDLTRAGFSPN
ncbi:MAG: LON peptidase substrate-binding domain-containing protein [Candidatus Nanopelagicales bacterium]